ncbi:helix-turn-helix domain-containing protein [Comamonas aquatica]|uniref:Helix-turn-helix domain-containing protein n=1 Tax=Comamonas aquatica TaxID=225991 RepID=A0AA43AW17_9BURK|nr:IclR family transcriptional regulator C-terminal domain-containing protein [Comamonas aquatica]MDH1427223.1 helix-turn-helix domain-containing protein [Comamonas aquatica]MDH1605151.1 helix-turn-helix domain-containing protein [Comamonas aquatica]MDH1617267.1 helix-turn-helix domain-containing protein [Comamonas aquatica]MDH2004917.1 helix-turn-helix domain-containing protein [Comamonas aquatica]
MNGIVTKSAVETTSGKTLDAYEEAEKKPGDTYVQSFARGLEVIRSFSADRPVQTLSEVAAQTGLTRAGARRILLTLQTLGYVECADGKHFELTPRILDLGFAYLSSQPLWNLAMPAMETLSEAVQESCSAGVLDGLEVVYVVRVHAHKIMSTNLGVGSRLPAFWTSMGRVLLAGLPQPQLLALLANCPREPFTRYTLTEDADLLAAIEVVRQQGWALINQELEEGLISVAAPLHNAQGQCVGAINVSGQANRTNAQEMQARIVPHLLRAAQTISLLMRTARR